MTPDSFLVAASLLALLAPWTEPVILPAIEEQASWASGQPVDISGQPDPFTRRAVVELEDRHLYDHFGIDPAGALRALVFRTRSGQWGPGGSGLAQQVVKLDALRDGRAPPRRSPAAKLAEAIHAVQLQALLGPDRVLDHWLSLAPSGRGRGLRHAPEDWHDTGWAGLDLATRAVLAATPRAPARLAPASLDDARRGEVTERAGRTLRALARDAPEIVPPELAAPAAAEEAASRAEAPAPRAARDRGAGAVARIHARTHGCRKGYDGGGATGCHRQWMEIAARSLAEGIDRAWGKSAARANGIHGCIAVIDGAGAQPIAVIGGAWPGRVAVDRCRTARREAGSIAKVLVWHTAAADGMPHDQVFADLPVILSGRTAGQADWKPDNAGGREMKPMTAHEALAHSVNRIVVRMALLVGPERLSRAARKIGFPWEAPLLPAAALGTASGPPLATGQAVHRLLSDTSDASAMLLRAMAGVTAWGTAARAFREVPGIAGKTGTTRRDNWFVGHDGTVTVVAWIGRDDGGPMPRLLDGRAASGGSVAADVVAAAFAAARMTGIARAADPAIRPYPRRS